MDNASIWELGIRHVVPPPPPLRSLKGRADILHSAVVEAGLDIDDDQGINGRHANIVEWPLLEEDILELAKLLAESAVSKEYI